MASTWNISIITNVQQLKQKDFYAVLIDYEKNGQKMPAVKSLNLQITHMVEEQYTKWHMTHCQGRLSALYELHFQVWATETSITS